MSEAETTSEAVAWEPVAEQVTDAVARCTQPWVRKAADDFYEALLVTTQDYLADNLTFNIAARLQTAAREQQRLRDANQTLVAMLRLCRERFEAYAILHRRKRTAEADEKAEANENMARLCAEALSLAGA